MKTPHTFTYISHSTWPGHVLALVAGALLTLAFAPFNYFIFTVISPLLLLGLWIPQPPAHAFVRGWFFGLGLFGSGISWIYISIHVYGETSPGLAIVLTMLLIMGLSLFPATLGWCYKKLFPAPYLSALLLGFPALWVLWEWVRSWLLTGFPWLYLGSSHVDSPLAGWVPLIGVYGVSFICVFSACSFIALNYNKSPAKIVWIFLTIVVWSAGIALKPIQWTTPDGQKLTVSLVQANIPQDLKWLESQVNNILNTYVSLTQSVIAKSDIVIWPEAAIVAPLPGAQSFLDQLALLAQSEQATIITGIPVQEDNYHFYNALTVVGQGSGTYLKRHLVPFGEYIPLEASLRGAIDFFDLPMSSFVKGPQQANILKAQNISIASAICYEIAYPNALSGQLPEAQVLLTVSNDTWFGNSIGPQQHFEIARMRALETGRYLLRATNNGISAIIDEKGKVTHTAPQFIQTIITGSFQPMQGQTPLSYFGHLSIIVLIALTALIAWVRQQKFLYRYQ